jgi:hypothetical protein
MGRIAIDDVETTRIAAIEKRLGLGPQRNALRRIEVDAAVAIDHQDVGAVEAAGVKRARRVA